MAYSFDPKDDVETQWKKWQDETPIEPLNFTEDELRERTIKELGYVSQMDVKEYTLFQKWCEVQEKYPSIVSQTLWGEERLLEDEGQRRAIQEIKNNFWVPNDPDAYLALQPELIYANKQDDLPELWNCIRLINLLYII